VAASLAADASRRLGAFQASPDILTTLATVTVTCDGTLLEFCTLASQFDDDRFTCDSFHLA